MATKTKANKKNFGLMLEQLTLAFMEFRLNLLMHRLVKDRPYDRYKKTWITILRGLEHAFLQKLSNVILKPKWTDQISIHIFDKAYRSKYQTIINNLKMYRNKRLSHIDEDVDSILDKLGLKTGQISNLFNELITSIDKVGKKYHPKTDFILFFNTEAKITEEEFEKMYKLIK